MKKESIKANLAAVEISEVDFTYLICQLDTITLLVQEESITIKSLKKMIKSMRNILEKYNV